MSVVRVAVWVAFVPLLFALGACSTSKGVRSGGADDSTIGRAGTGPTRGGYYLDDGPGHLSPADVAAIPDAVPRPEPVLARTARPYTVFGRTYTPMNALVPYRERGMASWYGRRYHGKPTSSGEPYDMYAMTAAHPTLPIPSYARVTRVGTGRSVVVRINDRGPFLQNRVIDLSYTAAAKLGFVEMGSAEVEVEAITQFDAPVLVTQAGTGAVGVATGSAKAPPPVAAGPVAAASTSPAASTSARAAVEPGTTAGSGAAVTSPMAGAPTETPTTAAGSTATMPAVASAPTPTPTTTTTTTTTTTAAARPVAGGSPTTAAAVSASVDSPALDSPNGPASREAAADRLVVETRFADGRSVHEAAMVTEAGASSPASASPTPIAGSTIPTSADALPASDAQRATDERPGFWLQFGAFASADGARAALERFRRELAWLGARFDVRREGALYKVQAGPWPQREHALDVAARVRRATTLKPFAIFR